MKTFLTCIFVILIACTGSLAQCPPTSLPFVDNFDGPTLDSCWSWIREDTSHWSLTERLGWMRISLQADSANWLSRRVSASRFIWETKMAFVPTDSLQQAGVMLYLDDQNYLSVARRGGAEQRIVFDWLEDGVPQDYTVPCNDTTIYVRITVSGNLLAEWSVDSTAWTYIDSEYPHWYATRPLQTILYTVGTIDNPTSADFDYLRFEPLPGTDAVGNVSGLWDSTGSPYYVDRHQGATVPVGETLTIRPGVRVVFPGVNSLRIQGRLSAVGTLHDSIWFEGQSSIEGIEVGDFQAACSLAYCVIDSFQCYAIQATSSRIAVSNCSITQNSGAMRSSGCTVAIDNCLVAHNNDYWLYPPDGIMNLAQTFGTVSSTSFLSNTGSTGVLRVVSCQSLIFYRCLVANNFGGWVGLGSFEQGSEPLFMNCAFINNAAPLEGQLFNGSSTMRSCIVWGIQNTVGTGLVTATYSDVQWGHPGVGNINSDPMFVDAPNGNYRLRPGSPCIDAGDPNSPLDPDFTRADMGALPFLGRFTAGPLLVEFGVIDVNTDSSRSAYLMNGSDFAVPVSSVQHANSSFSVDTSGLNGVVPPHSTIQLGITFHPMVVGTYEDTLTITVSQPDSVIRIPLSGQADILMPPVDSLVIRRGAGNSMQLNWAPITHSISGRPFTPPYYIIYGATTPAGPYVPIDMSPTNSYVHSQFNLQPFYFYRVSAGTEEVARRR